MIYKLFFFINAICNKYHFPYVRDLAVKFLSYYDCTFMLLLCHSRADQQQFIYFLSQTFTNHRTAGEGEGISLTPHYHFHPLHRHLDISWAITAESSLQHIANCRNRTRNIWFPSTSR